MTIAARSTAVVDAAPAFIGDAGMRPVIRCVPILGGVTARAIRVKHSGVESRIGMTGHAGGGEPRKLTGGVTALAFQTDVTPGQREVAQIVVESSVFPTGRRMTGGAVGAKPSAMLVLFTMAGVAIAGRAFVDAVLVAVLTFCFGVLALEFERGKVVVKLGGCPAVGGVTGGAVGAEAPLVRFIGAVAGGAILRSARKIGKGPRIQVTLGAQHVDVPAVEPENKIVPEIFPKAIHAVVAVETGVAVGEGMRQGKGRVNLTVTSLAGVRSESGDVAVMAVVAGERFSPSRFLVTV